MRDLDPKSEEAFARIMEHEGSFLLFWREQRGLTQEELAEKSGLELRRIQVLENDLDGIAPDEAAALSETLSVSTDDIVMPNDMIGDTMLPYESKDAE